MILDGYVEEFEVAKSIDCELHISALGFESRCMSLLGLDLVMTKRLLFLKFPESDLYRYKHNEEFAKEQQNGTIIEYAERNFLSNLRQYLSEFNPSSISIDISSMNRTMISAAISCIARSPKAREMTIYYLPAKFKPPKISYSDLFSAGPVLPEFSAFDDESDLPSTILMGLGYEYGVGLGLINLIEPDNAICLFAESHDKRYEDAVRRANLNFKFPGTNASALSYNLLDPASTYEYLSSTIRNLLPTHRVSLIPMGPKILSSLFVLAAVEHLGDVTLWRVVRNSQPTDAEHDGFLVRYAVDTRRLSKSSERYSEVFEFA